MKKPQKINAALAGLALMERITWKEDVARLQDLTPTERLVTVAVWLELSDKGIQEQLGLARSTIHGHVSSICKKLGKCSRVGIGLVFERALHTAPIRSSPWENHTVPRAGFSTSKKQTKIAS